MKKEELTGKNEFFGFRVESQLITQSSQIAKAKGTPRGSPTGGGQRLSCECSPIRRSLPRSRYRKCV